MLLGLYSLMQAIAPTTALHDTASLLIDNLHLTIDNHILVILIKHAVGLQQLLEGMNTLTLDGVMAQQLVFLVNTLLISKTSLGFKG